MTVPVFFLLLFQLFIGFFYLLIIISPFTLTQHTLSINFILFLLLEITIVLKFLFIYFFKHKRNFLINTKIKYTRQKRRLYSSAALTITPPRWSHALL